MLSLAAQKIQAVGLLALISLAGPVQAQDPRPEQLKQIVHDYIQAFSEHDLAAMMGMVTDDVQWLSVDNDQLVIVTDDRAALAASMASYFESCASCQSQIAATQASANRVSALEVVRFETANGPREMQSLSVYEFSGDLISRVYYFPAEHLSDQESRLSGPEN